ncbi:MAG: hypothetical protein AAGD28_30420 [Bacteroidota bacterium]
MLAPTISRGGTEKITDKKRTDCIHEDLSPKAVMKYNQFNIQLRPTPGDIPEPLNIQSWLGSKQEK